jgi:hypothetical protein
MTPEEVEAFIDRIRSKTNEVNEELRKLTHEMYTRGFAAGELADIPF